MEPSCGIPWLQRGAERIRCDVSTGAPRLVCGRAGLVQLDEGIRLALPVVVLFWLEYALEDEHWLLGRGLRGPQLAQLGQPHDQQSRKKKFHICGEAKLAT